MTMNQLQEAERILRTLADAGSINITYSEDGMYGSWDIEWHANHSKKDHLAFAGAGDTLLEALTNLANREAVKKACAYSNEETNRQRAKREQKKEVTTDA